MLKHLLVLSCVLTSVTAFAREGGSVTETVQAADVAPVQSMSVKGKPIKQNYVRAAANSAKEMASARREMKKALSSGDKAAYGVALERLNKAETDYERAKAKKMTAKSEAKGTKFSDRRPASVQSASAMATGSQTGTQSGGKDPCHHPRIGVPICQPGDQVCIPLAKQLSALNKSLDAQEIVCLAKRKNDGNSYATTTDDTKTATATEKVNLPDDAPSEKGRSPASAGGAL